jgi:hypothetical protein
MIANNGWTVANEAGWGNIQRLVEPEAQSDGGENANSAE